MTEQQAIAWVVLNRLDPEQDQEIITLLLNMLYRSMRLDCNRKQYPDWM